MHTQSKISLSILLTIMTAATACTPTPPAADIYLAKELSGLKYPASAPLGTDLDILLMSEKANLTLINRTASSYAGMQLWLNQEYVGKAPMINIGTANTLSLRNFVNLHGEHYPTGSFLNPDAAFPIVLAELYDPAANLRHRLVARVAGL